MSENEKMREQKHTVCESYVELCVAHLGEVSEDISF